MTQQRERLMEVSPPLGLISKQSAQKKSIPHGHIFTLRAHLVQDPGQQLLREEVVSRVRYRITQDEWGGWLRRPSHLLMGEKSGVFFG